MKFLELLKEREAKEKSDQALKDSQWWEVRKFKYVNKKRFAIYEKGTDRVLHDGNGYGYKTKENAEKVAWYYFKDGMAIIDRAKEFWEEHESFSRAIDHEKYLQREDGVLDYDVTEFAVKLAAEEEIYDFKPWMLRYK